MSLAQENQQPENEEKDKLPVLVSLKKSLNLAKELFIFFLIFYLILFVLETLFAGFVSNNFSLNWVLAIVLVIGVAAALAPEETGTKTEEEEGPRIIDYLTSATLGIIGAILIFYKAPIENFTLRLTTSIIAGSLVIILSIILLTTKDEEVKEREEEIEIFVKNTFLSRKTFVYPIAFLRLLFFKKVNFPLALILIVFLFTLFSLPKNQDGAGKKLNFGEIASFFKSKPAAKKQPVASPTPEIVAEAKKVTPSTNLMVKVLDGGGSKNVLEEFVETLKNAGFVKVFFGDADNSNYKDAAIKFRAEDKDQADLIKDLLKDKYAAIIEAPSATASAEITIILGALKSEKEETTELTPESPR
ncbi:hypothetical protein A3H87_00735 [Candidatus Curtissbacteria bacterium RIFCSPLOWO2_02_FULL_42_37]|nr:MAG: hypothetical protein A3H87_00735 [Candidatus Curtissbacteria bacterium RIFCSPLOWO2_02_FULL_42_37]